MFFCLICFFFFFNSSAGILKGKLLNLNDFLKYGETDLISAQCGLVQTLQNATGNNLCRQLVHHQSTLYRRLKQIPNPNDK